MGILKFIRETRIFFEKAVLTCLMKYYKVEYSTFRTVGIPFVSVAKGGRMSIGEGFRINSRPEGNAVGGTAGSVIRVEKGAFLKIGRNVGVSSAVIVATCGISIDDNVKIGAGTRVLDSDFHSLVPQERMDGNRDRANAKSSSVHIKENALIGTGSIILKGCTIGCNSVVGAGSVVTSSIPDNEIWGGNPARFIKKI